MGLVKGHLTGCGLHGHILASFFFGQSIQCLFLNNKTLLHINFSKKQCNSYGHSCQSSSTSLRSCCKGIFSMVSKNKKYRSSKYSNMFN